MYIEFGLSALASFRGGLGFGSCVLPCSEGGSWLNEYRRATGWEITYIAVILESL